MPVIYPESTPVLGQIKVKAALAIADLTAPKLETEVNAATSVDMSCAFMAEGWTPTTTQDKGTKMRRLCSTSDTEQLNPALHQVGTLQFSVGDPQDPEQSILDLMKQGAKIYFVERLGGDSEADFEVGQTVRVHYLQLGKPYPVYDTTADNAEFYYATEAVYVNNGPVEGVLAA